MNEAILLLPPCAVIRRTGAALRRMKFPYNKTNEMH